MTNQSRMTKVSARRDLGGSLATDYISRMTYVDLQRRLHDHPFKPFRIRMVNRSVDDILEPWMVMIGETSAVIATQTRKDDRGFELALDWKTVSIAHMLELTP